MTHFLTGRPQAPLMERYIDLSKTEIPKLCEMMEKGIVEFSYMKADGSVRIAHGTRCMSLIPLHLLHERMGEDILVMVNTPYFDVDKQAWRSFSNRNFIAIRSKQDETKEDTVRDDAVQGSADKADRV